MDDCYTRQVKLISKNQWIHAYKQRVQGNSLDGMLLSIWKVSGTIKIVAR